MSDSLKGVRGSFVKGCFKHKGCGVKKEDFFSSRYYNSIFPTSEKMAEAWLWCNGLDAEEEPKKEVKKSKEKEEKEK